MFIINVVSAVLGVGIYALFTFVFENLYAILISVVIVEMLKFFASEIVVCKDINRKNWLNIITESILVLAFYLTMINLKPITATLVYFVCAVAYILIVYPLQKLRKNILL